MSALPLFDAQSALGFVVAQTSIIESGVYRTVYPDIQYRDLIPVDTSGSEFATSVTYTSQDQYGKADWINGNADDIPKAGTTRAQFQTPVYTAGIGYGYGWEEIGRAQMLGINLPTEDAAAARRASEEMVDRVALLGDATKGYSGLYNAANVTPVAAPTGNWGTLLAAGTATPDQIVADMNAALMNVFNGTNTTAISDRQLLPWSKFMLISTKKMSDYSDMTILQYFLANNVYTAMTGQPLTVRGLRGLDTAGVGGVARMISYRYDANVLKLHMPMPHRFLPVYQSGPLRWDVPGVMRLGGLDVRLPKQVVYVDGI
ncbi:DUF2184 domain-containing protein [Xanthomonas vasicola]|uniref:DUF2184 domain-containing protein n=1 Tax=Xanthomonas vasicola TaxID=56459 RepID=UPI000530BE52|nr:major capsid family protein [Xanthomonas vasicola]AZR23490.1 DUF2184 domain-containing protein [Xanthomonas vasicola]KGR38620.1 hypothetical protein NX04_19790 [Xanthomonas vasicola]TWQ34011.1 DUF2184 domain-containing protein [Xanthomonas vasicola]TWQ53545.1 DUF2184 domain-containing protein [Xanthomonas vasicola]TWQ72975.1 DUF2184 domain-containing protein [Xanthomonas vasicola]